MPLEERMALFELFSRLGNVTWLDGFCGGGGSTRGIHSIPGQRTRVAINHWRKAVDVHVNMARDLVGCALESMAT